MNPERIPRLVSPQVLAYGCFLFIGTALFGSIAVALLASNLASTDTQVLLVVIVGTPVLFGSILAGILGLGGTILSRNDPFLWALSAVCLGMPIGYWLFEEANLGIPSADYYIGASAIILVLLSAWRLSKLWRQRHRQPVA